MLSCYCCQTEVHLRMTERTGAELWCDRKFRQGRQQTGQTWLWKLVSGEECRAVAFRCQGWCSAARSCSQNSDGACTQTISRTLGDQYTCMKYCMKYWSGPLCTVLSLSCCCASPVHCSLLHLLRAVRVVPSTGDRSWPVDRCTFKIFFKSHNGIGILFSMKTFFFLLMSLLWKIWCIVHYGLVLHMCLRAK